MARFLSLLGLACSVLVVDAQRSLRSTRAPSRITNGGVRPSKRSIVPPADDPFYTPPEGYESTPLGTVLNSRTVSVAALGLDPVYIDAWQLLYHTQGANDTSLATVTTVFKPNNATVPNVVAAFATAEDSAASICDPSYNYQLGNPQTDLIVTYEFLILEALLQQGWIVTSSDYQGPDSAFAAGRLEGHGVLDGIRATLNFSTLALPANTSVGGMGYSGGAIAMGWAAALQPTYAPELNAVGFAHGGTPSNISGTLAYIDGTLFSGFGPAGVVGLSKAYASINQLIEEIATPLAKLAISTIVETQCATTDIIVFAFQKLQSYVWTTEGPNLLYDPVVQEVTSQNILGAYKNETPTAPLYIYHAVDDEIIPIADIDTTVENYCANGVNSLIYERDVGLAEHLSMELLGAPPAILFLRDRFNGVAASSGCTINNVTTTLTDPGVLGEGSEIIVGDLIALLTGQIGEDDSGWISNLTAQASANNTMQQLNQTASNSN